MNRVGKDVITASLTGVITQTDIDVIRQIRDEVTLAQKHRKECLDKMEELCIKWFPKQMKNLQTVPGVSIRSVAGMLVTALVAAPMLTSCYDDSGIWETIEKMERKYENQSIFEVINNLLCQFVSNISV